MADSYEQMLMNQSAANSAFNAAQADINRSWQEYMSGTSHQREVKDLVAAGLNPVLSANSGSTWSSVGNAVADPTSAQGLSALATTLMTNLNQLEMSKISAEATKAAAGATAGAMIAAANINKEASENVANTNYDASTYVADAAKDASEYNTGMNFGSNLISSILGSPITSMMTGFKK